MNFSCPCARLEFTQNKLLVPPQNLFMPPQSRYPGAGPVLHATYLVYRRPSMGTTLHFIIRHILSSDSTFTLARLCFSIRKSKMIVSGALEPLLRS